MPAPIILGDTSGLAQGIQTAGSAFAQGIQRGQEKKYQAEQTLEKEEKQRKYGSILEETLGNLPQDASPMQMSQALATAMNQGVPPEIVNNYGSLYATLQKSQGKATLGPDEVNDMSELFTKFGMPEDVAQRNAELWGKLTTGGQTEMAKMLVDQITRQQYGNSVSPGGIQGGQVVEEDIAFTPEGEVKGAEIQEFKYPKVNIFGDRTPKERTNFKGELYKQNSADYKEIVQTGESAEKELLRYEQLQQLNESKKLPEGLERLNINWTTGDIRIPALANEETQQFVKTINDFTTLAKDSYGARVTNFELGAFMKRLPTLANTEAGRRLILEQVQAMKKLDKLKADSLKKVYDHYGLQGIDYQNADRIAKDLRKDEEAQLKKEVLNSSFAQERYDLRQRAPEGQLPVRKPDGSTGYLPIDQVDRAKKKGWEIL